MNSIRNNIEFLNDNNIILNCSSIDERDNFHIYPLGLPHWYCRLERNILSQIINIEENWKRKKTKTVLCSITPNTDTRRRGNTKINRNIILETLKKNGIQNIKTDKLNDCQRMLLNSKCVICPEGNGIDTHRLYESLLCGCIPIVEKNPYIMKKYEGLPILYTDNYSEITLDYLNEKYEEIKKGTYSFNKLFKNYYTKKQQYEIGVMSSYWLKKRIQF